MHMNLSFRRRDGSNAFHDPDDPDGPLRPRQAVDRGPARAPPWHGGDLRPHGQRLQAPETRHAERLPRQLGLRRQDGRRSRPVGAGRGVAHRAPDGRRRRQPLSRPAPRSSTLPGSASSEELELGPRQEPGADPNTDVAVPNTLCRGVGRAAVGHEAGRRDWANGSWSRSSRSSARSGIATWRPERRPTRRSPLGDRVLPPLLLSDDSTSARGLTIL